MHESYNFTIKFNNYSGENSYMIYLERIINLLGKQVFDVFRKE